MLNKIVSFVLFVFMLLGLIQCNKKPVGPQCEGAECGEISALSYQDVVIGCEGNFGWANASISVYNPTTKHVSNSVYQTVNGFSLGDVCQSMTEINGRLYVVINNSGKVQVVDTSSYVSLSTITGFTSPRYICKGNNNEAYVSDLYANEISIVDLNSQTITATIPVNNWTEEILVSDNKLWVTCPDTNWIIRIDLTTLQHIDTLILSKGVSSIVQDKNGVVWALSTGGIQEELPQLTGFDSSSGQIIQSFAFNSINESPSSLKMDESKTFLYFLNNGVYKMDVTASQLPNNPIILKGNRQLYGLGIDPNSGEVYVADALDYIQSGKVYRYSTNYQLLDQFNVGIIPQSFWFK